MEYNVLVRKIKQSTNGITLIALVVTVVVLLILAGISIGALNGENGIIGQAKGGKDSAEISEEKEIINISSVQAMDEDISGNITTEKLKNKLNYNVGEGKTEVIDNSETIVVKFKEKDRYYEIDKDGNVEGPKEIIKDEKPGNILTDINGKELDGTEEKPFQINCIEDLVVFSMMTNGGNADLGISSDSFSGKYVEVMRTLDFNSIFSYNDYTTTKYGDLNTDGEIEDIRTELTKTTENCIGFTPINSFKGIFDGKENEIQNIYQNLNGIEGGLFRSLSNATIKNITITGNVTTTDADAAGICGKCVDMDNSSFINCINKVNVRGNVGAGGIIGHGGAINCINCINTGKIEADCAVGGIAVTIKSQAKIINCYNTGELIGYTGKHYGAVGGIVGVDCSEIYNCYNIGKITSYNTSNGPYATAGGIIGSTGYDPTEQIIANVYNIGEIYGKNTNTGKIGYGGIAGGRWYEDTNIPTIKNAYFKAQTGMNGFGALSEVDGIYEKTKEYMYSQQLVTALNEYIENNPDGLDTTDWKKWKLGENGYPTFE